MRDIGLGLAAVIMIGFWQIFKGKTVSLVFAEQFDVRWQPDSFDIPVQKIITDKVSFGEKGVDNE